MKRDRSSAVAMLVVTIVGLPAACGDDLISPQDRSLPEGVLNVTYTACRSCPIATTAEDLLLFQEGVRARVRIDNADESMAFLTFLGVMSAEGADLLALLGDTTLVLDWNTEVAGGPAFFGGIGWGSEATIFLSFRRTGSGINCGLGFITASQPVGATSCSVD